MNKTRWSRLQRKYDQVYDAWGKDILFNTKDVCRVLNITDRIDDFLRGSSMDLSTATLTALSTDINDINFVEWLKENFAGYENSVKLCPMLDNDWNLNTASGEVWEMSWSKTKPATAEEWTIHVLNIHRTFFECWCAEVIEIQPGFNVVTMNYPVEFPLAKRGSAGRKVLLISGLNWKRMLTVFWAPRPPVRRTVCLRSPAAARLEVLFSSKPCQSSSLAAKKDR